ncbi:Acetoin utilization deacetylase AcuC [Methylobacillus rhizosphaerae]|uniref:Acetoin utilization deacetylase AcuC n=1 Tax=Methylobacillus rhizosphaerae TaxID=551994 RepID=A0A238ZSS9_9PROT|nr:histone deacetylase family protein [Methylobacillus rhizosphaerae]SNR86477.1 Acetoin utilization deacetylase AcuC [Methylobacillus rhizosphaerae]
MSTALVTHPDTLLHVMDGKHPESPARITAILDALSEQALLDQLQRHQAPQATDQDLQRVHDPAYIRHIRSISPRAGIVRLDPDTAMGPMSLSACLHAAGAAIKAVDLVMQQHVENAFCCVRPPGHHAGKANAAGFCIFNHIAIGVAHALEIYGLKRVAILDFDVHHGDGTEDIFRDDERVMLCSTFQHPFYPHRGAETRSNHIINVPLAAGSDGEAFRQAVLQHISPALQRFRPQMLFISAGFDAHEKDPLAQLQLTVHDYRWITEFALSIAEQHAEKRIVSLLEGGYHLPSLAQAASMHIRTLARLPALS